jgi:superfamily I DNA/RNA helicase
MFIGTIHAYCLHMLQDHVPEFGNFDILDENKLAGLLSREHKHLELSKLGTQHWRPIFDFLRNADVVENELLNPEPMKGGKDEADLESGAVAFEDTKLQGLRDDRARRKQRMDRAV